MRLVRPGSWELRITIGRWSNGRPRTMTRTVVGAEQVGGGGSSGGIRGRGEECASARLSEFSFWTVDEAIDRFLTEHLADEKGRAYKTISDYRNLHHRWFSAGIGAKAVIRVDPEDMDQLFGEMRKAGLSASRLNQAKSLDSPFFRWAKRRGITSRNPMADFQIPTSTYRSSERTPPKIEELCLLLSTAAEVTPDIAPILVLGAVTGVRRGELVGSLALR